LELSQCLTLDWKLWEREKKNFWNFSLKRNKIKVDSWKINRRTKSIFLSVEISFFFNFNQFYNNLHKTMKATTEKVFFKGPRRKQSVTWTFLCDFKTLILVLLEVRFLVWEQTRLYQTLFIIIVKLFIAKIFKIAISAKKCHKRRGRVGKVLKSVTYYLNGPQTSILWLNHYKFSSSWARIN